MPGSTGQHAHILHQERATKKVTGAEVQRLHDESDARPAMSAGVRRWE